ncbi:MAG: hypothetical protein KatS3mg087_1412 [Patescibacteria group bacterium]|nr:MAG: hypothetical protein KatS3mg087_1412 [Patescibacteria group bacterium]
MNNEKNQKRSTVLYDNNISAVDEFGSSNWTGTKDQMEQKIESFFFISEGKIKN